MADCTIGVDPGSTSTCSVGTVTINAVNYPVALDPTCTFCTPKSKATINTVLIEEPSKPSINDISIVTPSKPGITNIIFDERPKPDINDIPIAEPAKSNINDIPITEPAKSTIVTDPADPLYKPSVTAPIDDHSLGVDIGIVTEEAIDGSGQFDKYMRAGRNQLNTQYELGRIKGADYTNAYIAMQEGMMAQANQFILSKYQADAALAQAEVDAGIKKAKAIFEINLLKVQAYQAELDGLLTAQKIETEQLQQQMLATQEEEARKNGEVQRIKLEQDIQTSATTEEETRKNGEIQRVKIEQEIQTLATQEFEGRRTGETERRKMEQEIQTITTQEVETRRNGEIQRVKLEQDIQTAATQEQEARKNGEAQRTKLDQDIQTAATQEEEIRSMGVVERQLKTEQSRTTVAEAELKTVQKEEMGLTGQVDRAAKEAQVLDTLAASGLKATQQTELIANGSSKRALENGQNKVGVAQCELYAAQAAGFGDRNRNDTFKTIMNAWAVDVAENDNTETPSPLHSGLENVMKTAITNSNGLSET